MPGSRPVTLWELEVPGSVCGDPDTSTEENVVKQELLYGAPITTNPTSGLPPHPGQFL